MTYMFPFPQGTRITQPYGVDWSGLNPSGAHGGIDYGVQVGTPIRAACSGKIVISRFFHNFNNPWLYGPVGGLIIGLDEGQGKPFFGYGHTSYSYFDEGTYVTIGDIIGLSGKSSSLNLAPHTHVDYLPDQWNVNNGAYGFEDPLTIFDEYYKPDVIVIKPPEPVKDEYDMASLADLETAIRNVLSEPPILDKIALAILKRECDLVDPTGKTQNVTGKTTLAKKINWAAYNNATQLVRLDNLELAVSELHEVTGKLAPAGDHAGAVQPPAAPQTVEVF